jgi:hypothetical protein
MTSKDANDKSLLPTCIVAITLLAIRAAPILIRFVNASPVLHIDNLDNIRLEISYQVLAALKYL